MVGGSFRLQKKMTERIIRLRFKEVQWFRVQRSKVQRSGPILRDIQYQNLFLPSKKLYTPHSWKALWDAIQHRIASQQTDAKNYNPEPVCSGYCV